MNRLYLVAFCTMSLSVGALYSSDYNEKNEEKSDNPLEVIMRKRLLMRSLSYANYRLQDVVVSSYPYYKDDKGPQRDAHAIYNIQDPYGAISYDLLSIPSEIKDTVMTNNDPQTLQLGYLVYSDNSVHFTVYLKSLDNTPALPIFPKNEESNLRLGARLLAREIEEELKSIQSSCSKQPQKITTTSKRKSDDPYEQLLLMTSPIYSIYRLCNVTVRPYTGSQYDYRAIYDIQDPFGTISYDLSSLPPEIKDTFMKNNDPQTLQLGYEVYNDNSSVHFTVYLKSLDNTSELAIVPKNQESDLRLGARLLAREAEKGPTLMQIMTQKINDLRINEPKKS